MPSQSAWIYVANVTLGTPPQSVVMQIDTGSSDFWINTPNSPQCTSPLGCPYGAYSANSSSTYQYVNGQFYDTYLAETMVSGDFATDVLNFGGSTLKGLTFGIAYNSSDLVNLWGVALPYQGSNSFNYTHSVAQMVAAGLIQSPTFSLWLNSPNATAGSILFGGVDTSKYTGQLQTYPVLQNPRTGMYDNVRVNLTGITFGGTPLTTNTSELGATALLDTGNPLTIVPMDLFTNLVAALGLQSSVSNDIAVCPCSLMQNSTTLGFQFPGLTINVPLSGLVTQPTVLGLSAYNSQAAKLLPPGACVLMVVPQALVKSNDITLGDSFLENAYVVHDLANSLVSMAQTNFNPGSPNILEIPAGTAGVAAVVQSSGSPSSTGTSTGTSTATATSSSSTTSATAKSGASTVRSEFKVGLVISGALMWMAFTGLL